MARPDNLRIGVFTKTMLRFFGRNRISKLGNRVGIPREKLPQNSMSKENPDPERMGAIDLNLFRQSSNLVLL
ncbi:hypothetical protein [Leptospira weilii]|uniref:hypothetical protein n=1 Tax=Leptospira weilii TaxID=28184 RepID=UPI001E351CAC|nr:hypothetical protein [Leptospira weilii]